MLRGSEDLEKGPWDPSLRELERLTREPEGLRAGSGPVKGKKIKEGGWGRGRGLRACRKQEAGGRVLTHHSKISPGEVGKGWSWSQADRTGQRQWPAGRERGRGHRWEAGGGWGVGGRQETDEAWTGRKQRTRCEIRFQRRVRRWQRQHMRNSTWTG